MGGLGWTVVPSAGRVCDRHAVHISPDCPTLSAAGGGERRGGVQGDRSAPLHVQLAAPAGPSQPTVTPSLGVTLHVPTERGGHRTLLTDR